MSEDAPVLEHPTCEVCQKRPGVGVAAVPGVPISVSYCRDCLLARAQPLWIVVMNTALSFPLDVEPTWELIEASIAEWYVEEINRTLKHLEVPRERFLELVRIDMREMQKHDDEEE